MTAPPPDGQKLDWRTLIVHAVTFKQARAALSAAAPALAALGLTRNLSLPLAIGIVAAVTALSIGLATLRWTRLRYHLTGSRLTLSEGVIGRRQRVVPIDRIRGVSVQTPALHRILGLAVLAVDAAAGGQAKEEVRLDAVRRDEAERLRDLLLARSALAPAAVPDAEATATPGNETPEAEPPEAPAPERTPEPERVHARLRRRWLLYTPLVGAYLIVPISALGVASQWLREADVRWVEVLVGWVRSLANDVWTGILIGLGALVVILLGALVAGSVSTWGFVLVRRGGQLVAERGLVGRHASSLEVARIRGYVLQEPIGLRLVRAARLLALVTGMATYGRRGLLLPIGPRSEAARVADEAVLVYRGRWNRHPPVALRRRLVRAMLPGALLAAAALSFGWPQWIVWSAGALVVLGGLLGIDRYRALAHGYDGAALAVRSGSLRRRTAVMQRQSVVGWRVEQSFFQRRSGVATVTVLIGAGLGGYSAIDCAESDGRAWLAEVTPEWTAPLAPPATHDLSRETAH